MKNIILIGFMGSGKSTVGKVLAREMSLEWVDIDHEIENKEKKNIQSIFDDFGEKHFRDLETKYLEQVLNHENRVVSTGGGVVLREENIKTMKRLGTVVFLNAESSQIIENVKNDDKRPLLKGEKLEERVNKLMGERAALYLEASDIIIQTNGKNIQSIVDEIISLL